jgi:hypothetical protein
MNQPINIQAAVLDCIAADDGIDRGTMSVGAKDAVFFRRDGQLLTWGQKGSQAWLEIEVSIIAKQAIRRAARI